MRDSHDLESIVPAVRQASREFVRELDLLDVPHGSCTMSECHALIELGRHDVLTAAQLGRHLRLEKSTISRKLTRLQKKGLVRSRQDPDDGRYKRLALAGPGRTLLKRIDKAADRRVSDALALLTPVEQETVLEGFRLYVDALARSGLRGAARTRRIRRSDNDRMYEHFQGPRSTYFVAAVGDQVVGGAGIAPLNAGPEDTCELQKMYLLPAARGRGQGKQLLERCLKAARAAGFRQCYLETMPQLTTARALYEHAGFRAIPERLGDTGHPNCQNHYLMSLD
jgi:putative acetyltransferase